MLHSYFFPHAESFSIHFMLYCQDQKNSPNMHMHLIASGQGDKCCYIRQNMTLNYRHLS